MNKIEFNRYKRQVLECNKIEEKLLNDYEIKYRKVSDEKISIHVKHKTKLYGQWFVENNNKLEGLKMIELWVYNLESRL